jgi:hypothetical protein
MAYTGGGLVNSRVLREAAPSPADQPSARLLVRGSLHPRLIRSTSFIVISLLALGLWVAIWEAVTSMIAAVMQ